MLFRSGAEGVCCVIPRRIFLADLEIVMRRLFASALAVLFAAPALASSGMTTTTTVMRQGPTTKARAIMAIPSDARIDIGRCDRGWCFITFRSQIG